MVAAVLAIGFVIAGVAFATAWWVWRICQLFGPGDWDTTPNSTTRSKENP
ncbi:YbjC family protein [Leifsonia aquatica]|nr:YbjC family protein [Leifsonia aquatica]